MGHVLSGWDGTNPLPGPSDEFYQIVDRYSHSIAALFWGHTVSHLVLVGRSAELRGSTKTST